MRTETISRVVISQLDRMACTVVYRDWPLLTSRYSTRTARRWVSCPQDRQSPKRVSRRVGGFILEQVRQRWDGRSAPPGLPHHFGV